MPDTIERPTTISLIGMPGAGKSTVGVILAKRTGLRFIDSDLDIQQRAGATLQDILERHGYRHLRALEEEVLLETDLSGAILATGGSAVYSARVMARLCSAGPVVYLRAGEETLSQRVAAAPPRGMANDTQQAFAEVYAERTPLYEHYANLSVDSDEGSADSVAEALLKRLAHSD